MKKRILYFLSLILFYVATPACAAVQNQGTDFQSVGSNGFSDYPMSNYENLAQLDTIDFVVTEEDVKRVQQALLKLGYYQGNVDGLAHRETVNSIVALQRKEGLTITGEIDKQLLSFLGIR